MRKKIPTTVEASRRKALFAEVVGISNPDFGSFVFLVLFLCTLGWFTDTLLSLLQTLSGIVPWEGWSYYVVGLCPFFIVSGWGWSRWRDARKQKVRLQATTRDVEPHAGVVLFLSNIRNPAQIEKLNVGDASVLDKKGFIWKMCHYGLEKHSARLKKVWAVCSPESFDQYADFVRLFQPMFPQAEFLRANEDCGISFEDMEGVVSIIEDVLHTLPHDMDESDVIIDITSGQKPNSVAGALVTLISPGREFQYVQTNDPHEVKTYAYQVSAIGRKIERKA